MSLSPSQQNLWRLRALSERKWLSTGKGGISHQGYFQYQLPTWPAWSPGMGAATTGRNPRTCLGLSGIWRLVRPGRVQAGGAGAGKPSDSSLTVKKGTERVSLGGGMGWGGIKQAV